MSNLWTIRWLRRFFRRRMKPMPVDKAHLWKQRLSFLYVAFAWNAFGIVCYMMYTGRSDWAKHYGYKSDYDERLTPGQQWAQTLKVENPQIVRFSGFRRVKDVENPEENQST